MSNLLLLKGRYQLIRELGGGGMGIVYEGHDSLLDRPVAVKVLSEISRARLGSEGRTRLLREAQAAAKLNHPNIVGIYDAGEDQGISFIVMELVEGESLYDYKPQSIEEVLAIAQQICAALEHAHTNGIIHRDLKPENVLITPAGKAKLTDFGLARSFSTRVSVDGLVVGTVFYLAPEAALRQPYDGRVDLYSLGVILYELTTGTLPFSADDPLAVISQHLYAPVIPPRAHKPEIPAALDALIVQLLSKQPENRPASAGEVRKLLIAIESSQRLESGVVSAPEYSLLDRIVRGRLVGREHELAQMSAAWRQAASGQGSVLLISGEPGIGKTRLARELIAQALVSGGKVMSGSCYVEGGVPYDPFPQIIRDTYEATESLIEIPRFVLADLIQIAPDLRPRHPEVYPNPPMEPQSEQQRIFESVATWIASLCAHAPFLLFIDDIHWADSGTLSLLRYLARRLPKLRLLILITYREIELNESGPLQTVLHDLNRERLSTRVKLARFDRQQSRALLASILSPRGEIEDTLVDKIFLETEGNPFFIEEVCKALIEAGKLTFTENIWSAPDLEEIDIPQSVRVTLQTRIARLPTETQEVLRCAAVLGRQFDSDTLQRVCGLDEDTLIVALESAERAQIISEAPRGRGPSLNFAFAHALIPTTLADQFSGLRRQRLHRNAAMAIEVSRPEDYETLGYHFERAGDTSRAQTYYLRAGDRALDRYANQEAERYYRSALEMNEDAPEISHLLSNLGEVLFRQSRYEEATSTWEKAIQLYQKAGDSDNQARYTARQARAAWYMWDTPLGLEICRKGLASLGNYMEIETPGVATLIHETARACFFNNLPDEALQLCQHALKLARQLELVDVEAETLATLGILPNQSPEDAIQALMEAVELSESSGLLAPAVRAHANLGEHLHNAGDLIGAREHLMRSREVAHRLGIPDWEHSMLASVVDICFLMGDLAYIQTVLDELKALLKRIPNPENSALSNRFIEARIHRFKGEWEEALPEMRQCSQEAKQRDLIALAAGINVLLGELLLELNETEEAEKVLLENLQFGEKAQQDDRAITPLLLSSVRIHQGRLEEARTLIESIRPTIKSKRILGGEAFLLWSEAQLASAEKKWEQAFAFYGTIDNLASQLGLPWYRARILAEWAGIQLQRGQSGDLPRAIELYDQSIAIFQQLGLPLYESIVRKSRPEVPQLEFHISRQARDRYQFDETLFSLTGNVLFANFHATRLFTQKMNQKRDLINFPEQAIRAGQINALGLIDEILHMVIAQYHQQRNPAAMEKALQWLYETLGRDTVDATLRRFTEEFPPVAVYRRQMSVDEYLSSESAGVSHRQLALEEMLMLWVANANPACAPFLELFDDSDLMTITAYSQVITGLRDFFATQPFFGPDNQSLVDMLRSPAIAVPHSLPGQLEFIRTRWGGLLGQLLYRLLSSLDLIKEEEKIYFAGLGPAPARVLEFTGLEFEIERFSPDQVWMPSLVLLAKNAYVWLDQLSKKYQRSISRLDEIPDEELNFLAASGFTGLWLIGLWERSPASKRIKQLRGNPDAVASAYSLFAYDIAADLGGEEAYQTLRQRAWQRGIRLASDMVPNHMGIDSRWVVEHPDWFVSLDYSPYPSYSFNGPDLSWDQRVTIQIEDHYYNNSDAAVVFKRFDHWSGETKFIYHGNDGTSMPWNDTAQLNYLKAEVREAVIQTILHVARKFPIIRFDAAMTLAKRHYQRLWYPEPGGGGDIPSRAEHGLTKAEFDAAMPIEFWREVVDRVAQETPGTLLLAEAFWLMEGYFVRTLGMHRVYNSAFMNMLRDEKNQEYRLVVKNTLEFDPEILKRYVSFMNNPDERTAVDQFGKGDKYFGICTLLATLPGLPMFGHGQIEGFTEKYGMEYRRAYWDEQPDVYLVDRHQREIFPLLRKRYLFAEARDFLLYDFFTPEGGVNEDVYAYTNRSGDERALVIYHNKYASASGWIRTSSAYLVKSGEESDGSGGNRQLVQKSLGEGLGLADGAEMYTIFRDHISGLEYIRNNRDIHQNGLYIELGAYQYHVFLDFRQVGDDAWRQYSQLNAYLNGRGVPSIEGALKELLLQAVQHPFRELVNAGFIKWLKDEGSKVESAEGGISSQAGLDDFERRSLYVLQGVQSITGASGDPASIAAKIRHEEAALLQLLTLSKRTATISSRRARAALKYLQAGPPGNIHSKLTSAMPWGTLHAWIASHRLGEIVNPAESSDISRSWIDEWQLGKIIITAIQDLGVDGESAARAVSLVKLLTSHQEWSNLEGVRSSESQTEGWLFQSLQSWLRDVELQHFLGFNRYQGVLWFQKEGLETWLWWIYVTTVIELISLDSGMIDEDHLAEIVAYYELVKRLQKAAESSGYQVEKLIEGVRGR